MMVLVAHLVFFEAVGPYDQKLALQDQSDMSMSLAFSKSSPARTEIAAPDLLQKSGGAAWWARSVIIQANVT